MCVGLPGQVGMEFDLAGFVMKIRKENGEWGPANMMEFGFSCIVSSFFI